MEEEPTCPICKDPADIPHTLPCNHIFCYLCIIKHIRTSSSCPSCSRGPFTFADLLTSCRRHAAVPMPAKAVRRTAAGYVKILKKYKIRTDGHSTRIIWRYNELIDQLSVEQFRETPASLVAIAYRVHKTEQLLFMKRPKDYAEIINSLLALKSRHHLIFRDSHSS